VDVHVGAFCTPENAARSSGVPRTQKVRQEVLSSPTPQRVFQEVLSSLHPGGCVWCHCSARLKEDARDRMRGWWIPGLSQALTHTPTLSCVRWRSPHLFKGQSPRTRRILPSCARSGGTADLARADPTLSPSCLENGTLVCSFSE